MVRYSDLKDKFEWKWDHVALSFWKRYPNPESSHVLSEDIISREVRDGKIYTKRLLTKTNIPPKWAEKMISSRVAKVLEESVMDAKGKTIVTYTRNIGYVKILSAVEKVVYRSDDENENITVIERSAWVESRMFGLNRAIERFCMDRLYKNSQKAMLGFKYVINNLFPNSLKKSEGNIVNIHTSTGKEKLIEAVKQASKLAKSKTEKVYTST